jgi:hypothetical protein
MVAQRARTGFWEVYGFAADHRQARGNPETPRTWSPWCKPRGPTAASISRNPLKTITCAQAPDGSEGIVDDFEAVVSSRNH